MIVYQATKDVFIQEVFGNIIDQVLIDFYFKATKKLVSPSEQESWKTTVRWMRDVLRDPQIPQDVGVSIEYHLPQSAKRIDFVITGKNDEGIEHAVLIELKQWSSAKLSDKDAFVHTDFFGEVVHPSYQAWSYAALLEGFNATVYEENIKLKPCAYLHNYREDAVIKAERYSAYLEKAPVFLEGDEEKEKLQAFIKRFMKHGDSSKILFRIDAGKIRPSKSLADSLAKMIKGNQEFVLIDDQKLVYETALALAKRSSKLEKNVLIVHGGPGTGKSVVAINLLATLTKLGLLAQYVTKNAAPRTVYESKLTGVLRKTEISNLFSGSGSFIELEKNTFDTLIVDEAHRLNEKSGMFKNLGENQIKEIIDAATCSIFFIDEDQRVTWHDIGTVDQIKQWAATCGAQVHELQLASQFRCSGSDGYLAWVDDVLQIKETANVLQDSAQYDVKVVDSAHELRELIFEKNKEKNKARLVAGYCWDWVSKKNKALMDIRIPEEGFAMRWNLASDGNLWILAPESVNEAGCIHTSQGLELEYIGVIIGPDLIVRNGKVITQPGARAKTDSSLRGYKQDLKANETLAKKKADLIIKNTYRTLITRGMKGCYIYCTDKETREYFKQRL